MKNLKPWNREHPDHRYFTALILYRRAEDLTTHEAEMLHAYTRYRRKEAAMTPEAREKRYRALARKEAKEAVKRAKAYRAENQKLINVLNKMTPAKRRAALLKIARGKGLT